MNYNWKLVIWLDKEVAYNFNFLLFFPDIMRNWWSSVVVVVRKKEGRKWKVCQREERNDSTWIYESKLIELPHSHVRGGYVLVTCPSIKYVWTMLLPQICTRSFKLCLFQIDPFKFLRFQIGPLSFEFVSDSSFLFNYFSITEMTYLKQTRNLKDISETLET